MKKHIKLFKPALICFTIMTFLCGILYTLAVTGIAQFIFPEQANGSIITVTLKDGSKKEFGSKLIAQKFTDQKYLIGRPQGVTNLSPTSNELKDVIQSRIDWWHSFDPDNTAEIPADLVMSSGSGVDPNISMQAAKYQVSRIASSRNMKEDDVNKVIATYTSGRFLGFIGEPAVNVLKVNLALDGLL